MRGGDIYYLKTYPAAITTAKAESIQLYRAKPNALSTPLQPFMLFGGTTRYWEAKSAPSPKKTLSFGTKAPPLTRKN